MEFELRIRCVGQEGDEVTVLDLGDDIIDLLLAYTDAKVKFIDLVLQPTGCHGEGRKHATRN